MRGPADAPKAILFDWGGTLIDYPASNSQPEAHAACLRHVYERLCAEGLLDCRGETVAWERFQPVYMRETLALVRRTGETWQEHSFLQRFEATCGQLELPALAAGRIEPIIEAFSEILVAHCRPMPGAEALLSRLAGRVPLAVVSNFPHRPVVEGSLEAAGLQAHLDAVVVSCDIGLAKPHPEIYRHAAERLGVALSDCLFVGDEPIADVEGPARAGCRTVLLRGRHGDAPAVEPTHRLDGVAELARLPELQALLAG